MRAPVLLGMWRRRWPTTTVAVAAVVVVMVSLVPGTFTAPAGDLSLEDAARVLRHFSAGVSARRGQGSSGHALGHSPGTFRARLESLEAPDNSRENPRERESLELTFGRKGVPTGGRAGSHGFSSQTFAVGEHDDSFEIDEDDIRFINLGRRYHPDGIAPTSPRDLFIPQPATVPASTRLTASGGAPSIRNQYMIATASSREENDEDNPYEDDDDDDLAVYLSKNLLRVKSDDSEERLELDDALLGKRYNFIDGRGSVRWGYDLVDQYQHQTVNTDGTMEGRFGWTAPNGQEIKVKYVADDSGYRLIETSGLYLEDSEDVSKFKTDHFQIHKEVAGRRPVVLLPPPSSVGVPLSTVDESYKVTVPFGGAGIPLPGMHDDDSPFKGSPGFSGIGSGSPVSGGVPLPTHSGPGTAPSEFGSFGDDEKVVIGAGGGVGLPDMSGASGVFHSGPGTAGVPLPTTSGAGAVSSGSGFLGDGETIVVGVGGGVGLPDMSGAGGVSLFSPEAAGVPLPRPPESGAVPSGTGFFGESETVAFGDGGGGGVGLPTTSGADGATLSSSDTGGVSLPRPVIPGPAPAGSGFIGDDEMVVVGTGGGVGLPDMSGADGVPLSSPGTGGVELPSPSAPGAAPSGTDFFGDEESAVFGGGGGGVGLPGTSDTGGISPSSPTGPSVTSLDDAKTEILGFGDMATGFGASEPGAGAPGHGFETGGVPLPGFGAPDGVGSGSPGLAAPDGVGSGSPAFGAPDGVGVGRPGIGDSTTGFGASLPGVGASGPDFVTGGVPLAGIGASDDAGAGRPGFGAPDDVGAGTPGFGAPHDIGAGRPGFGPPDDVGAGRPGIRDSTTGLGPPEDGAGFATGVPLPGFRPGDDVGAGRPGFGAPDDGGAGRPGFGASDDVGAGRPGFGAPDGVGVGGPGIGDSTTGFGASEPGVGASGPGLATGGVPLPGVSPADDVGAGSPGFGAPDDVGGGRPGFGAPDDVGAGGQGFGTPDDVGAGRPGFGAPDGVGVGSPGIGDLTTGFGASEPGVGASGPGFATGVPLPGFGAADDAGTLTPGFGSPVEVGGGSPGSGPPDDIGAGRPDFGVPHDTGAGRPGFGAPHDGDDSTTGFGAPETGIGASGSGFVTGVPLPGFATPDDGGAGGPSFGASDDGGAGRPSFGASDDGGAGRPSFGASDDGGAGRPSFGAPDDTGAGRPSFDDSTTAFGTSGPDAGVSGPGFGAGGVPLPGFGAADDAGAGRPSSGGPDDTGAGRPGFGDSTTAFGASGPDAGASGPGFGAGVVSGPGIGVHDNGGIGLPGFGAPDDSGGGRPGFGAPDEVGGGRPGFGAPDYVGIGRPSIGDSTTGFAAPQPGNGASGPGFATGGVPLPGFGAADDAGAGRPSFGGPDDTGAGRPGFGDSTTAFGASGPDAGASGPGFGAGVVSGPGIGVQDNGGIGLPGFGVPDDEGAGRPAIGAPDDGGAGRPGFDDLTTGFGASGADVGASGPGFGTGGGLSFTGLGLSDNAGVGRPGFGDLTTGFGVSGLGFNGKGVPVSVIGSSDDRAPGSSSSFGKGQIGFEAKGEVGDVSPTGDNNRFGGSALFSGTSGTGLSEFGRGTLDASEVPLQGPPVPGTFSITTNLGSNGVPQNNAKELSFNRIHPSQVAFPFFEVGPPELVHQAAGGPINASPIPHHPDSTLLDSRFPNQIPPPSGSDQQPDSPESSINSASESDKSLDLVKVYHDIYNIKFRLEDWAAPGRQEVVPSNLELPNR